MKFSFIIFDFDGTIADTRRGVFDSIIDALTSDGYEVPDENVLNSFLGPPLYESFQKTTGCSDEMAQTLTAKYRELYTDNAMYRLTLFDGVREMLEEMKEKGIGKSAEDVLSYALFPQVATEFFKYRQAQKTKVDPTVADTQNGAYPV